MQTQELIFLAKNTFGEQLAEALQLTQVVAPLFVSADSGIQDNLNGTERPIAFQAKQIPSKTFEIVHSLAKWKRWALAELNVPEGEGIYTDMRAIRPDEPDLLSGIHSIYVDQWDWEKVMTPQERNLNYLKDTIIQIYKALKRSEAIVCDAAKLKPFLPKDIQFVHVETLIEQWPDLSPREREDKICQEHGAVFLIGIGGCVEGKMKHDGRAPDYDDWSTSTSDTTQGLNGDILVWNPILNRAFEISSMGIRVNKEALLRQLNLCQCPERQHLPWHQMLLRDQLPLSIGGGIGQSRVIMLLLQKHHIGEVQVSVWPAAVLENSEYAILS